MCKLPTYHADDKNGWNGANNNGIGSCPCAICGCVDCEKVSYHSSATPEYPTGHMTVCWPCSQNLDATWHGCGCGG